MTNPNPCTETPCNETRCNETRSTRLHYQLRCLLPVGHDGNHAWTPELLPMDEVRISA